MNLKLGTKILNACEKANPIKLNGDSILNKNSFKFDCQNPYILDAIPDEYISEKVLNGLETLNGKDISKIEKILNNYTNKEELTKALSKLQNIFGVKTKGFNQTELNDLIKKSFPNVKIPTDINTDAMVYLSALSKNVGSKFDAHGMAKISVSQQLIDLNSILTKGIDKNKNFCTAPLVASNANIGAGLGTCGGSAYRDGSFILVGEKGKMLKDSGIKHVIVNDAYYSIFNDLQKRFPNINFVKAENACKYFEKL